MARGKGRKNESTSKAKIQRDLGKGPAGGRTGGGAREANPQRGRATMRAHMKEVPVLPAEPVVPPGGKRAGGKAGGKSGGGRKAMTIGRDGRQLVRQGGGARYGPTIARSAFCLAASFSFSKRNER